MVNKKFVVKLSGEERERLREVISRGKGKAKSILKARILLKADQGWADAEICRALDTNISMVARVRETLVNEGLDAVHLLAEHVVERKIVESAHFNTVARA